MARHEIMIHENTSATKESAPYLGSYISKETLKTDEFAAKIAEKGGLPAIQVQAIVAGAFDAIEELERDELVRLHVDGFTVCGVITGSFPTADAKFDPDKNALQGYEVHGETKTLGGKVKSLPNGHEQEIYFSDDGHGEGFRAYADLFGVGERIQLTLTPNPERTDIDQSPAVETAVVTEG